MNQKRVGSTGEKLIRRALNKHRIRFIFDAPISFAFASYPVGLGRKRFDFVLINEDHTPIACIEYDGKQHYEQHWYGRSSEEYIRACSADDLKTKFCENMKLPLLRIRYDQNDLIENIVENFLLCPKVYQKQHNPIMDMQTYWAPRMASCTAS